MRINSRTIDGEGTGRREKDCLRRQFINSRHRGVLNSSWVNGSIGDGGSWVHKDLCGLGFTCWLRGESASRLQHYAESDALRNGEYRGTCGARTIWIVLELKFFHFVNNATVWNSCLQKGFGKIRCLVSHNRTQFCWVLFPKIKNQFLNVWQGFVLSTRSTDMNYTGVQE